MHRPIAWAHVTALRARDRLSSPGGQGTVEYVALILLVGAILTAVVAAGHGQNFKIAETIGHKLSDVINTVGAGKN